ncbi:MAG: ribosome assembly factor SBDS [archaeon]|nr:ribosome assembly factor SBDS [archaeon]MCP8305714.1 ribosome assembly factor SBDS [archaeon]
MSSKFTTVRLVIGGERFEILVHPKTALDYKLGRPVDLSKIFAVDGIFSEASKGLRVSEDKLEKFFNTTSVTEVAEIILKKGELQLITEQRRSLIEDKKKQIISIICKNFIDPRTGLPHPRVRVEQAMSEVQISIDPFKDAKEQAKTVIEKLRVVLPLKSEKIKLMVKIEPQFAPKTLGVLKSYGEIQKEDWLADGSLNTIVEIPAGVHASLIDKLGSITKGTSQVKIIK